ncbi:unnamed protein product [Cuscuta epithymum]|uniref:F-box domain-containing protein n=1 Tax=Cuscuta epithymum TaxID=186058 RepID=A0AAV0G6W0_9ASTE|nr:unnamed protein product [Cuscuta epithymum]
MMPYLTEDLITEILSRLPTKPLIRFKCVSKRWNSLISDPKFAILQLKGAARDGTRLFRATRPPQSLDCEGSSSYKNNNKGVLRKLSYPAAIMKGSPSHLRTCRIRGSCNGLIDIVFFSSGREFLWNPTTGDYIELPEAPRHRNYGPILSGVGYNVSSDDYGVLNGTTKWAIVLFLYTVKTGKWREIQDVAPDLVPYLAGKSISWNGDMFWLGQKPNSVHCLGSFDLKEVKFKEIQLPYPLQGHKRFGEPSLGISSGNSLCVFCEAMERRCFEAWAMKVDKDGASSWNILFSFPHDKFQRYSQALFLTKEGEVVMRFGGIYLYNPEERKSEHFQAYGYIESFADTLSEQVLYIESLVSPNTP